MSILFCDTNLELWWERAEALKLNVISMPYVIDGKSHDYDLGKNTDFKNFYGRMRKGAKCLTQALNPQNYVDYFEPHLKKGDDILYIHFSNQLSATFDFMNKAIEELLKKYPDRSIKTVDTGSISIGASALLYEATLLHMSGAGDEEVIDFVNKHKNHYTAYFVVDDLNHLKRGGRISSTKALMGTVLGVKPVLTITAKGKIEAVGKEKGKKKAMLSLVKRLKEEGKNVADHPIIIAHADCEEDAFMLSHKVREYLDEKAQIWVQPIGPTIGTHAGPGTIAISFYSKKRVN